MTGFTGHSSYNPAMRFWLLVFLAVLMSVQAATARVGSYGKSDIGASVNFAGLQVHQHNMPVLAASDAETGIAVSAERDCGACHLCCAIPIPGAGEIVNTDATLRFCPFAHVRPGLAPPDVPDRPQWWALT